MGSLSETKTLLFFSVTQLKMYGRHGGEEGGDKTSTQSHVVDLVPSKDEAKFGHSAGQSISSAMLFTC